MLDDVFPFINLIGLVDEEIIRATFKASQNIEMKLSKSLLSMMDGVTGQMIDRIIASNMIPPTLVPEIRSQIKKRVIEAQENALREAERAEVEAMRNVNRTLPRADRVEVNTSKFSPLVQEKIKERVQNDLGRYSENLVSVLDTVFTEGHQGGWGIDKIAKEVAKRSGEVNEKTARRIARTEIQSAQQRGSVRAIEEAELDYMQWWSSEDDRVRGGDPKDEADHTFMHGQIIPVGGTFSNGLAHPGDESGDIAEWINCRCFVLPFLVPDGMKAPDDEYFYEEDLVEIEAEAEAEEEIIEEEIDLPLEEEEGIINPIESLEVEAVPMPIAQVDPLQVATPEPVFRPMNSGVGDELSRLTAESLTERDKIVEEMYVASSNSFKVNRYLYDGLYEEHAAEGWTDIKQFQDVDHITKLIDERSVELRDDTVLTRASDTDYLLNLLGENNYLEGIEGESMSQELNRRLGGAQVEHKAFTSTSFDSSRNMFMGDRDVIMKIEVPAGSKAYFASDNKEAEVILQRGSKFEIIGFETTRISVGEEWRELNGGKDFKEVTEMKMRYIGGKDD